MVAPFLGPCCATCPLYVWLSSCMKIPSSHLWKHMPLQLFLLPYHPLQRRIICNMSLMSSNSVHIPLLHHPHYSLQPLSPTHPLLNYTPSHNPRPIPTAALQFSTTTLYNHPFTALPIASMQPSPKTQCPLSIPRPKCKHNISIFYRPLHHR